MAERRRVDRRRVCLCAGGLRKRAFSSAFLRDYGRGAGVGRGRGVGVHLPAHGVGVGVGVGVAVGVAVVVGVGVGVGVAVGVGVGVGAPDCAQYLPPVFRLVNVFSPPQT